VIARSAGKRSDIGHPRDHVRPKRPTPADLKRDGVVVEHHTILEQQARRDVARFGEEHNGTRNITF
jgi:hypothetical protein